MGGRTKTHHRCTGYRPILDAAASFTTSTGATVPDVEDLASQLKQCLSLPSDDDDDDNTSLTEGKDAAAGVCQQLGPYDVTKYDAPTSPSVDTDGAMIVLEAKGGAKWYQPQTLDQTWLIMRLFPEAKLIAGNTSIGIYKDGDALIDTASDPVLISLQDINELHGHAVMDDGSLGKLDLSHGRGYIYKRHPGS